MIITTLYDTNVGHGLKPMITALAKLPYSPDQIVDQLQLVYNIPEDNNNEDFVVFTLVVADQFHRRGFESDAIYSKAIGIIDELLSPENLATTGKWKPQHIKFLNNLKSQLQSTPEPKTRTIRKSPQKLVLSVGDVISIPLFGANKQHINPYFKEKDLQNLGQPTGYKVALAINSNRAFDYLAFYRLLCCDQVVTEEVANDLEKIKGLKSWSVCHPGTLSENHYKKLKLEKIGHIDLTNSLDRVHALFVGDKNKKELMLKNEGAYPAACDVSLSNFLYAGDNKISDLGEIGVGS